MVEAEVRYVDCDGRRPALGVRGRKYASCVVADASSLSVIQVELREFDQSPIVTHGSAAYSPQRAAEHFLATTRRRHQRLAATKEAMRIIRNILDLPESPGESDPPNTSEQAAESSATRRSGGPLRGICAELSIEPAAARRILRAAGLRAPYDDATTLRKVLTTAISKPQETTP